MEVYLTDAMRWFLFEVKGNKSYFFFTAAALSHCWAACCVRF